MKISNRFRRMCQVYKIFAADFNCDLSEEALHAAYIKESTGVGTEYMIFNRRPNGYIIGKKWLNVQVAMWLEDIRYRPLMDVPNCLYADSKYPTWWLRTIFNKGERRHA